MLLLIHVGGGLDEGCLRGELEAILVCRRQRLIGGVGLIRGVGLTGRVWMAGGEVETRSVGMRHHVVMMVLTERMIRCLWMTGR